MWHEVTLGVAEVRAVKPYVRLIRNTVKFKPTTLTVWSGVGVDVGAVGERAICRKGWVDVSPMAWHMDFPPFGVIQVGSDCPRPVFVANFSGVPNPIE